MCVFQTSKKFTGVCGQGPVPLWVHVYIGEMEVHNVVIHAANIEPPAATVPTAVKPDPTTDTEPEPATIPLSESDEITMPENSAEVPEKFVYPVSAGRPFC